MPDKKNPDPETIFDALAGSDEGENWRHMIARGAFLEALINEPRVLTVFMQWGRQTGILNLANRIAVQADRLAQLLALTHRRDLFLKPITLDASDLSSRTIQALDSQKTALEAACRRFEKAIDDHGKTLLKGAMDMVRRDLELCWPFVAKELLECFFMKAWSHASGVSYERTIWFEPKLLVAHKMTVTFTNGKDLKRELARAKQEGLALVKRSALPRGVLPKKTAEAIRRNALWFCRAEIGDVPIPTLAKEYHDKEHGDITCENDAAAVRIGIRETRRLLNLTQFHLK